MKKNKFVRVCTNIPENVNHAAERFGARIQSFINNTTTKDGLVMIDRVRSFCQNWLSCHGCLGVWLVPIDNYINEYSSNNFIAYNTYYKKHFALIQSPQIQKEAAAIAIGDNFRIVDCFRAEKTDFSHCSIFQQLDVELVNRSENETRAFAELLIQDCLKTIQDRTFVCLGSFPQTELIRWYGTEEPNLCSGCYIANDYTIVLPSLDPYELTQIQNFVCDNNTKIHLEEDHICIDDKSDGDILYKTWHMISNIIRINPHIVYAYWIINLPLAKFNSIGKLQPVHHIMSKPLLDKNAKSLSLFQFSDAELCSVPSRSYDLMLCSRDHVVEVIGGDARINTYNEQLDAIKRFGLDPKNYAFLLEALHINDLNNRSLLAGFAMGLDRLTQFIINEFDMSFVQLFPTNMPDGEMVHAVSFEDAGVREFDN